MAYLGFQKGGGRYVDVVGCGGGGCAPSPEKNRFFSGILARFFISYRCNNGVQNPFSVPYNLLRVFEDDNTTVRALILYRRRRFINHLLTYQLYTELSHKFLVTSILGQLFNCAIRTPVFRCSSSVTLYAL